MILVEPIRLDGRIRDLDQLTDGTFVLWMDGGYLMELTLLERFDLRLEAFLAGLDTLLRDEFRSTITACLTCHKISPYGTGYADVGPNLWRLVGHKMARHKWFGYSPVMKLQDEAWTVRNLDWFLKDPQAFLPGNKMNYPGIAKPELRKAIIDFLRMQQ